MVWSIVPQNFEKRQEHDIFQKIYSWNKIRLTNITLRVGEIVRTKNV